MNTDNWFGFAPIYPGIPNTIRELLLLSPQNRTRKVGLYGGRDRIIDETVRIFTSTDLAVGRHIESLAKDILLHFWATVLIERVLLGSTFAEHFVLGPDAHRNFQECLVQEGNAGFETPSHCGPFRNVKGFFLHRVAVGYALIGPETV